MAKRRSYPFEEGFKLPNINPIIPQSNPDIFNQVRANIKPLSQQYREALEPLLTEIAELKQEAIKSNDRAGKAEQKAEQAEIKAHKATRSGLIATWTSVVLAIIALKPVLLPDPTQRTVEVLQTRVDSLLHVLRAEKSDKLERANKIDSLAQPPTKTKSTSTKKHSLKE